MFHKLGYSELFKYKLIVHANNLVIKIKFYQLSNNITPKEESNPNKLNQMTE